jgi:ribose transport system substrate-binding protein
MKRLMTVFLMVAIALTGCFRSAQKSKNFNIAVIPKGTMHEFWKSIHAGAIKASQEFAKDGVQVSINWKGPLREDDREQQIQVVEGFLSQGVDGIVLAPLDSRALVRPVEEASRAGIPTVIFDSGLESENIVSFVATDNFKGGVLAADRLGSRLEGKGKALVLRYLEGSASTEQREAGFLHELKAKYPSIDVLSSDQYAGPTRETAYRAAQNLLNRFANQVEGVFTPNEST